MPLRILIIAAVLVAAGVGLLFWERDPSPREALEVKKLEVEEAIVRSEARVYAPEAAQALRDSMAAVEHLFETESRRLPFFRHWDAVRQGLARLDGLIQQMEAQAQAQKEALLAAVQRSIDEARDQAGVIDAEIATAPRSKDSRRILPQLRAALEEARAGIDRAQSALDEGHVASAREEIEKARASLEALLQEVQDAKRRAREYGLLREPAPPHAVLVVDVEACRFTLVEPDGRLRLSGPCSTGKDQSLRSPDGRQWQFSTPKGARRVYHKAEHPLWCKPDWAYLEEGRPVPAADTPERLLHGMLGAYALDIGGGYLVHGSPYRRGVGERNTHGCVRLLDEDLAVVYRSLEVGDLVLLR